MKQAQIRKPNLNTTEAIEFATKAIKNENEDGRRGKGKDKIIAEKSLDSSYNTRIFFAPKGDKRLTISIKQGFYKKLKIAAIEGE